MTTFDILFKRRYLVKVPKIAIQTPEEYEMFGEIVEKDNKGKINKNAKYELTTAMLTVEEMVDVFISGYQIRLLNNSDMKIIYDAIEDHLARWNNLTAHSMNLDPSRSIPKEDLMNFEKFANEIFDINKREIINKSINSSKPRITDTQGLKLVSATTPIQNEINYDIDRKPVVSDTIIKSKYNLNELLKDI